MELWYGKERFFSNKILTTPKMEFLRGRKQGFFGLGESLPGSNSSGIEKFSKFPECDFPTSKQGPKTRPRVETACEYSCVRGLGGASRLTAREGFSLLEYRYQYTNA